MTTFQKLLINFKNLSFSQKITIVGLFIASLIAFFYLSHLNNQEKLSQCKYLFEQGILSSSAQEADKKSRGMIKNGTTQGELDEYWRSLDEETRKHATNIFNLVGKYGDVSKVSQDCRDFLLNP